MEKQLLSSLIFNIALVINEKPLKIPPGRNMRLLKCGLGRSGEIIDMQDLSEKLQLDFKKEVWMSHGNSVPSLHSKSPEAQKGQLASQGPQIERNFDIIAGILQLPVQRAVCYPVLM